ncbi:hypothetical protein ABI59_14330 [Acidobacteria bacterium Mor1]|nr:hypothetical protein ABI59_14330 [Acidobacteria bacterium Mor1]
MFAEASELRRSQIDRPAVSDRLFRVAADLDPFHAPAQVKVVELEARPESRETGGLGRARVAAESAVLAAPDWERSRLARARVEVLAGSDLTTIAADIEHAVDQNPGSIESHLRLAHVRGLQGRRAEARRAAEQAYARLPTGDGAFRWRLRVIKTFHALSAFDRVVALSAGGWLDGRKPKHASRLLTYRAFALAELGRRQEALELVAKLSRRGDVHLPGEFGYLLATLGSEEGAMELVREMGPSPERGFDRAKIYVGLGREELALDLLEELLEGRARGFVWVPLDPVFESLDDEPRFSALLARHFQQP